MEDSEQRRHADTREEKKPLENDVLGLRVDLVLVGERPSCSNYLLMIQVMDCQCVLPIGAKLKLIYVCLEPVLKA